MVSLQSILTELDLVIKERHQQFSDQVRAGSLDKAQARDRYDSLVEARAIVDRHYARISEDLVLSKVEILREMMERNPHLKDLVEGLKLKIE